MQAGNCVRLKVDNTGLTVNGSLVSGGGGASQATPTTLGTVFGCTNNGGYGVNSFWFTCASTFLGFCAGNSTSYCLGNIAVGASPLRSNTTGYSNTAIGNLALQNNTAGYCNTAIGTNALAGNTTGYGNVAVGPSALGNGATGNKNIAIGLNAGLSFGCGGGANIAIGPRAMWYNSWTTGPYTSQCFNIAIGHCAMFCNIGYGNIGIGVSSLLKNGTGRHNIAIGKDSLVNNTTGNFNIAIGCAAGYGNTYGSNNIFFGQCADGATATSCNTITLGNSSITTIRAQVQTITALSDCRDKTNICSIPVGLDFVRALRPVKFDWNMRDGAKVGIPESGFIAQELDQVQQQFNAEDWLKLVLKENPDRLEATPGKLLPVLVKAMQEMAQEIDQLRTEVNSLLGK